MGRDQEERPEGFHRGGQWGALGSVPPARSQVAAQKIQSLSPGVICERPAKQGECVHPGKLGVSFPGIYVAIQLPGCHPGGKLSSAAYGMGPGLLRVLGMPMSCQLWNGSLANPGTVSLPLSIKGDDKGEGPLQTVERCASDGAQALECIHVRENL